MERLRRPIKACFSITRQYLSQASPPEKSSNQPALDHIFERIPRPRPASLSSSPKNSTQPSSMGPDDGPNITWGDLTQTLSKPGDIGLLTTEQIWTQCSQSRMASIQKLQKDREHAGMYWGRSFPVVNGNFISAYARVMTTLRENNVRRELRLTERFEKPTDRRRRLRSERHRRRFADMISQKVKVVRAIRERGG